MAYKRESLPVDFGAIAAGGRYQRLGPAPTQTVPGLVGGATYGNTFNTMLNMIRNVQATLSIETNRDLDMHKSRASF